MKKPINSLSERLLLRLATGKKLNLSSRHHRPSSDLHLTAMIDIFTILLFFLIKTFSAQGDLITMNENLHLPLSNAKTPMDITLIIEVTKDDIIVEGRKIDRSRDNTEDLLIPSLKSELLFHARKTKTISATNHSVYFTGKVTILADKTISFRHLQRIMYTCSIAEYNDIALAVFQNNPEKHG